MKTKLPTVALLGAFQGTAPSTPTGPMHDNGRTDLYLTDFALDRMASGAGANMATTVFPVVPVRKQSSRFRVWPRGYFLRPEMRPKPYGDVPVQAHYKTEEDTYNARRWALERVVDDEDYENTTDALEPERGAVNYLLTQRQLTMNIEWARTFMKDGVWTFNYSGTTGAPGAGQVLAWDQSGSTPIRNVRNAAVYMGRATNTKPNIAVVGAEAFEVLLDHMDVRDRVKYTALGQGTEEILQALLGIERIYVAGGSHNTAPEGLPDDFDFTVDSTGLLLAYANPNPSAMEPSAGYTFSWDQFGGVSDENNAMTIRRGRDDRAGANWFQGHTAFDMKVVAPDLGVYFRNIVTPFLAGSGDEPDLNL